MTDKALAFRSCLY